MEGLWVTIMDMGIALAVSMLLPIVLLIVWVRKKRGTGIAPFWAGAAVFIIFSLFLEQILHYFVLVRPSALSGFVNENLWVFALYGSLAAGVFEETGRFLAFKTVLGKKKEKENAVTYGIGHGGAESILVVGISMASSLILVLTIRSLGGVDGYVKLFPAESQNVIRESLESLLFTPSYHFLMAGIERISAVIFHIALSVLVFFAAQRPGKWYLYPLAIFIHMFLDIFAVLYQKGVLGNLVVMEIMIAAVTAATVYFAYRIYQGDEKDLQEEGLHSPPEGSSYE